MNDIPLVYFQPFFTRNTTFVTSYLVPLRKHAYSNILKILPLQNEIFQINNSDSFHISAQIIDCGYSLEPSRGSIGYPTIYVFEQK